MYRLTCLLETVQGATGFHTITDEEKAGFVEQIGAENFCTHIDTALERAAQLEAELAAAKQN